MLSFDSSGESTSSFRYFAPLFVFGISLFFLVLSIRFIQILNLKLTIPAIVFGIIFYFVSYWIQNMPVNPNLYLELRFIPLYFDLIFLFSLLPLVVIFLIFRIKRETIKKYPDVKLSIGGWKEYMRREYIRPEKKQEVKNRLDSINDLVRKNKLSAALTKLKELERTATKFSLKKLAHDIGDMKEFCQILTIKDFMLDLGTKYEILKIGEIMEKTGIKNEELVVSTIISMIENEEIYAEYFESTNNLKFDKSANIREIDKLMETYETWEKEGVGKREKA